MWLCVSMYSKEAWKWKISYRKFKNFATTYSSQNYRCIWFFLKGRAGYNSLTKTKMMETYRSRNYRCIFCFLRGTTGCDGLAKAEMVENYSSRNYRCICCCSKCPISYDGVAKTELVEGISRVQEWPYWVTRTTQIINGWNIMEIEVY